LRRGYLNIFFLLTTLAALGLTDPASGEKPLMPAPVDRPALHYESQKGTTIKRDKWGVMDPTPSVIALKYLQRDKYGFIDWAMAIREGLIAPKDSLGDKPSAPPSYNKNVLIKSKLKFMPDVIFPHKAHNTWLSCEVCHPKMFRQKAGATGISMLGIWNGQFCGRCHDKVAFPIRNCFKCHSVSDVNQRRHRRSNKMKKYRRGLNK